MGGVFSDGASSGRLRTGADTQWVVSPPGDFRAINIILTLNNPFSGNTNGSGTKNDGYQISITNGMFSTVRAAAGSFFANVFSDSDRSME